MSTQHWDPERYAHNARFVADLGIPVVELLDPQPGERILDLGCGDGALTEKLAALGCQVLGVDASPEQVAAARTRGLAARVLSGRELDFEGEFDAVFSNAALHWMGEPGSVVRGVARALRPGGRFVAECGGEGNIASIVGALEAVLPTHGLDFHNPWYFAPVETYRQLLAEADFQVLSIQRIPRPTPLPTGIPGWLATFGGVFLAHLDNPTREAVIADVEARLRPVLCDGDGNWTADYVRLRFAARRG